MRVYLDNCCFNRPFDDQSQLRINLETEAKLKIQEYVTLNRFELIWSYMLDYENFKNPYLERKTQIAKWNKYAVIDVEESIEILTIASDVVKHGIKIFDSLHVACAIKAKADCFLTTDDGILKKEKLIQEIKIMDPIEFIKELSL